jgi:hypothetical protein
MAAKRSSCVALVLAASCSDVSFPTQMELEHGVTVAIPADWSTERGPGHVVLRGAPRDGQVDLASALAVDYGVERTPARVLAGLRVQVASIPGSRILRADAGPDRVLLEWNDARGRARRHIARFIGGVIVHVACTDLDPHLCDEIAAQARAHATKAVATTAPPPAAPPLYPRYARPTPAHPNSAPAASEPRAPTRMDEYAAGLQARAERIDAQRVAGVEVLP